MQAICPGTLWKRIALVSTFFFLFDLHGAFDSSRFGQCGFFMVHNTLQRRFGAIIEARRISDAV